MFISSRFPFRRARQGSGIRINIWNECSREGSWQRSGMNATKTTTMHAIRFLIIVLWIRAIAMADGGAGETRLFGLSVGSEPDSALVVLDDSVRGMTPCTLSDISAGNHTLILRKKGFYIKKVAVIVDSLSSKKLFFTLLKPASLWIFSEPSRAILTIDGKNEGVTPYADDKVKPGDHVISAKLKGYMPIERAVSLQSSGRDTVNLIFERSKAYQDSVAVVAKATAKAEKEHHAIVLASAVFCLAAIILILIESGGGQ